MDIVSSELRNTFYWLMYIYIQSNNMSWQLISDMYINYFLVIITITFWVAFLLIQCITCELVLISNCVVEIVKILNHWWMHLFWVFLLNSKWIKDLSISHDTIKILEENIGGKISDIPHSNIFADISARARDIRKEKQMDYIKIKSFWTSKENISKMKWEPTVWVNIFANDTWDKGLISYIHKEPIQLNTTKTNNPIKKWAKNLGRHFSKEDIQKAQRHMRGCSTSIAIREIQIKTTMRYLLSPIRMAITNKSTNKCWWGCGENGQRTWTDTSPRKTYRGPRDIWKDAQHH